MMVVSLLLGRTLNSQLSDDMKSRIAECRKSCDDLKQKFGARLAMNTNRQGTRIEGDAKEIKGDVKEIKGNIDRNSKCRIHNDVYSSSINHDVCRCQYSKYFKDNKRRPAR